MLSSVAATRYAHQLLEARALSQQLQPFSVTSGLTTPEAYQVAERIMELREARGERLVGRKIGFSNRKVWRRYGLDEDLQGPIWAPLFDGTVRNTGDNTGLQSLEGAVQPRIEPEVVFGLGAAPKEGCSVEEIALCVDWMAHAIEVAVCPYPGWKFNAPDAIAAFGLHGTLIIGERKALNRIARNNLTMLMSAASISLSCSGAESFSLRAAGFGSDVFGSPVHALLQLHRQLCAEPQFPPLAAGEIVATGSWTNPFPIEAGQTWSTAFSGLALPGMSIGFV